MLQLNVLELLAGRGITNPQRYLIKQGIPYYTVSRLVTNKSRNISFDALEQLCLVCKCTPDELFVWVADEATAGTEPVALEKLKPKPKLPTAAERLRNLSAEQVQKLQEFMDELERNK